MNILEIRRRQQELADIASKALADEQNGTITTKAFVEAMTPVAKEYSEITDGIMAYNASLRFAGLDGADAARGGVRPSPGLRRIRAQPGQVRLGGTPHARGGASERGLQDHRIAGGVMKIKVAQGVQVVHDGKVHDAGETADVAEDVAAQWVREGWGGAEVKTKGTQR
jgi:hypothetical protein